jgi:hypothetical protein
MQGRGLLTPRVIITEHYQETILSTLFDVQGIKFSNTSLNTQQQIPQFLYVFRRNVHSAILRLLDMILKVQVCNLLLLYKPLSMGP